MQVVDHEQRILSIADTRLRYVTSQGIYFGQPSEVVEYVASNRPLYLSQDSFWLGTITSETEVEPEEGSAATICYIEAVQGAYVEVSADVSYSATTYDFLEISGNVTCAGYCYASEPIGSRYIRPKYLYIYVNGKSVSDPYTINVDETFLIDSFRYDITEDVTRISYRFVFDAISRSHSDPEDELSERFLSITFSEYEFDIVPGEVPVKDIVKDLGTKVDDIFDVLTDNSKQESADSLVSDMNNAVTDMDSIKQEIEQGLEKPAPETIVPDIDVVVDTGDEYHVKYTEILADLLGNTMITNLLLIVSSMVFVSYVLFGKKE